jgi:hypothetical protein
MKKLLLPLLIFAGIAQAHAQTTLTQAINISWKFAQGTDTDIATGFNVYGCSGASCSPLKLNATPIAITTLAYSVPSAPVGAPYTIWITTVDANGASSAPDVVQLGAPPSPTGGTTTTTITISATGSVTVNTQVAAAQ